MTLNSKDDGNDIALTFATDQEKAEALNHSRPFDVHKWSDFPEVNAAVEELNKELSSPSNAGSSKRIRIKHIKVVTLDLYVNWLSDPTRYISFHRDKSAYKRNSRYNKIHVSSKIINVIDYLSRLDYIEIHKGFYDRKLGHSRLSRMKAKDKLIELFTKKHKIPNQAVSRYKDTECIILRDIVTHKIEDKLVERKEDIEYRDTVRTRKMRKDLQLYNDLLQRTEIRIPDASESYIKAIIKKKKKKKPYILNDPDYFVRRVFNNGSWDQGGRYHGGWWQRIPSDLRVCITLNSSKERLDEVDYLGLHIVILYAMEGIDYWKQYGRDYDPYKLDGYEQTDRMRDLLKFVLLTAINASDKQTALSAVQKELNFNPDEYLWVKQSNDIDLSDLIDAFSDKHKPIKKYMYSKMGIQLQNIDSKIADIVVNHFTKKGVPTLCIHDSFLIDTKHSNELIQIMSASFTDIISGITSSSVDVESLMKLKTWYDVLMKYE